MYRDWPFFQTIIDNCECLGYSEGAAHRRIRAARCLKDSPEIYFLIAEGKLTLSALAEVSPVMTKENTETVLALTQGASKAKAAEIAAQFGAVQKVKREAIRPKRVEVKPAPNDLFTTAAGRSVLSAPQVEECFSFSFEVTKEVAALYQQAKSLIGPCAIAEVFERVLREYVAKRAPKVSRVRTSPAKLTSIPGKRVPAAIRREVFQRDAERCTYVSPDGVHCSEHSCLQVDHIQPVARGGSNEMENLRLLCRAHNQLLAEQWFGREFIAEKRRAAVRS